MEYKLSKPIKTANGETIETLNIDFDELTIQDIKSANKVKKLFDDSQVSTDSISPRLDSNLRIALAWISAIKHDNRLSLNDVLSISAKDAMCLSEEALNSFF